MKLSNDLVVTGQRPFHADLSPVPDLTHSIEPGQRFRVLESINEKQLRRMQKKNSWVLSVPVNENNETDPEASFRRIPLTHCALEGTLESYPWFFVRLDRQGAVELLRRDGRQKGSFIIRTHTGNMKRKKVKHAKYSLSLLSRERSENDIARIVHYTILETPSSNVIQYIMSKMLKRKGKSKFSVKGSLSKFKSLTELVDHYTQTKGGLNTKLMIDHQLEKDAYEGSYYSEAEYKMLDKMWDMEPETLQLGNEIGSGNFGTVHVATFIKNSNYKVAVKLLKCTESANDKKQIEEELAKESQMMKKLHHKYVVQLIGIYRHGTDQKGIVTELMESSMEKRLDETNDVKFSIVFRWLMCITAGMEYLSGDKLRLIHRDLRTANVLVKGETAKIADFGISKIMEGTHAMQGYTGQGKFPWRWTAPERQPGLTPSSHHDKDSSKIDVYSFGCLIFEALNYSEKPYSQFSRPKQLLDQFAGNQATNLWLNATPKIMTGASTADREEIVKLVKRSKQCVSYDPNDRPDFQALLVDFEDQFEAFTGANYEASNDQTEKYIQIASLDETTDANERRENLHEVREPDTFSITSFDSGSYDEAAA